VCTVLSTGLKETLPGSNKRFELVGASLRLSRAELADAGTYVCNASNFAGSQTASSSLVVLGMQTIFVLQ
jgi:hypothetical protein